MAGQRRCCQWSGASGEESVQREQADRSGDGHTPERDEGHRGVEQGSHQRVAEQGEGESGSDGDDEVAEAEDVKREVGAESGACGEAAGEQNDDRGE